MRLSLAPTWRLSLALGVVVGLAGTAAGHVAPAAGDNNRYLKLTAMADRVRLAYTVFYGETPGAALRREIDTSHDGAIDDTESQAFAQRIAADVAAALVVTVDGAPRTVAWSQVVVGLATPRVAAGAFSIDLVASLCLAAPRGRHAVVLRDHYPLARPGETQAKAEDSPGVALTASRIGGASYPDHDYTLVGPSGALDTEGFELQFTAGDQAPILADGVCKQSTPGTPVAVIAGGVVAAVALAGLAGATVVALRRRARRRGGSARAGARDYIAARKRR